MLASGRFVTPTLGGAPYYDKPVGFHWAVALSLEMFGRNAAAARLPSALAALATLGVTAWWALRLGAAGAAVFAPLGLGTTLLFLAIGRLGTIDMLFTALLTCAVALLSARADEPEGGRGSVLPFYVLVGLATLVKGPVAIVLTFPCLVAASVTLRRRGEVTALRPLLGALVILAVAGPWYAAAAYSEPVYMRTFLGLHNLDRFAGSDELGHQSSIFYYALTLPAALLPWTPLVAAGCLRRWQRSSRGRLGAGEIVLWTWMASIALLFGAASTRLVTYLLPAFPALFVAASSGFVERPDASERSAATPPPRWLGAWTKGWAFIVALAAVTASAVAALSPPVSSASMTRAVVTAAVALSLPFVASRCVANGRLRAMVLALATTTFVAASATYGPVADLLTSGKGYRELAPAIPPDGVVTSFSRPAHALSFYLDRPVGRVHDVEEARALLAGDVPVFLLVKSRYVAELLDDRAHGVEVAWRNEQGSTLLVNESASTMWRRREGVEPSADLYGRQHGFEDRSGHRTRSLSVNRKSVAYP